MMVFHSNRERMNGPETYKNFCCLLKMMETIFCLDCPDLESGLDII